MMVTALPPPPPSIRETGRSTSLVPLMSEDETPVTAFTPGSPNDLTGHWRRPQQTSETNERIRELSGSSWVERQLYRQMEEEFMVEGRNGNTELVFMYPRNTRGAATTRVFKINSAFEPQPGPLGVRSKAIEMRYVATAKGVYFCSYISANQRCVRFTARSACGTRLNSRVRVQRRADASGEWVDVANEPAFAVAVGSAAEAEFFGPEAAAAAPASSL